jgi:hypothetical protein
MSVVLERVRRLGDLYEPVLSSGGSLAKASKLLASLTA